MAFRSGCGELGVEPDIYGGVSRVVSGVMQTTSREMTIKERWADRGERLGLIFGIVMALIFAGLNAYSFWYMWHNADVSAGADD